MPDGHFLAKVLFRRGHGLWSGVVGLDGGGDGGGMGGWADV